MRTLKRTLAIMTCFAALSGFTAPFGNTYIKSNTSLTAIAAEKIEVWDGTIDTSWYDDDDVKFHIRTPQEFAGLSELINSGKSMEGKTFYLDSDIYMNDISSDSYTNTCKSFSIGIEAIFEGNNHTIYGWNSNEVFTDNHGTIQNLTLKDGSSSLCDTNTKDGHIINCNNYNNISSSSYSQNNLEVFKGGLCSKNEGTILNCSNQGNITVSASTMEFNDLNVYVGGISGRFSRGIILNCENYGNITSIVYTNRGSYAKLYIGGISGDSAADIKYCNNYGNINADYNLKGNSSYLYSGGIAGSGNNISYCTNNGEVISTKSYNAYHYTGGICGTGSVLCCKNTGDIKGKSLTGGIAGYSTNILHSCNYGNITSEYSAGGIVGSFGGSNLKNVYNRGDVNGNKAAGICTNGDVNCAYNTGIINADSSSGINFDSNENCYYLNTTAVSGGGDASSKSSTNMKKEAFAESLGSAFVYVENDYPVLFWEKGLDFVEINTTKLSFTEYGQQETLTTESTAETDIKWSSDNEKIATVDENGVVTAIGKGTCKITASVGDAKASCTVTVDYDYYLSDTDISLKVDAAKTLTIYSKATDELTEIEAEFYSTNEDVAEVNKRGIVSANAPGEAEIHAMIGDCDMVCTVTVETVRGDVNADGELTVADLVMMQKWLLNTPDAKLNFWKAGDLCQDNVIDVFDLVLMRKELLENN